MKSIVALIFLLLPSILLALKNRSEYGRYFNFTFSRIVVLIMLVTYIFTVAIYDINYIEAVDGGRLLKISTIRIFAFYVLPGISIAIIFFPKVAAEYTELYVPLAQIRMLEYFSLLGWVLLFLSVISASVWYV